MNTRLDNLGVPNQNDVTTRNNNSQDITTTTMTGRITTSMTTTTISNDTASQRRTTLHHTLRYQDPVDMSIKGQPRKAATSRTSTTWRAHSPPGSLMSMIRHHSSLRLYIDPLLWTPYHTQLLKVSVSEARPAQPHRPSCQQYNSCGTVLSSVMTLLRSYPYRTEKDRNLTRLIRSTVDSFCTSSGTALFKSSRQCQLPFSVGGKRQCWVMQPLLVRDISSGMPLVAFTHESARCDALESRRSRFAGAGDVVKATHNSDIHPHDVAVLIVMAQEAQRVQSRTQDHRGSSFTVSFQIPLY